MMHQEVIQDCPECRGLHTGQFAHCEECWAFLALPSGLGRAPAVLPSAADALTPFTPFCSCPLCGLSPVIGLGEHIYRLGRLLEETGTLLSVISNPPEYAGHTAFGFAMGLHAGNSMRRYLGLA